MMKTKLSCAWKRQLLYTLLMLLVRMLDMLDRYIWCSSCGPRFAAWISACCTLMNYGIRHKYANLSISLVMALYCKLQWLIYYVWTKDWSEEVLAASFMALSQLLIFTSWKNMNSRGSSSKLSAAQHLQRLGRIRTCFHAQLPSYLK